jgi:predicted dehydrogenase
MLQDGVIGKVREIHAWSGAQFPRRGRSDKQDLPQGSLDWDRWLGVAPVRPYVSAVYHPFEWRGTRDFGTGGIGDFGCHILDTPFKAMELTAPLSIRARVADEWAERPEWIAEHYPDWEVFEYVFPGTRFTDGPIPVTWYDGAVRPARELFGFESDSREIPGGGSLFIGEGGRLLLPHVAGPQLVPYRLNQGIERPDVQGFSHYHAFVDACLGLGETGSHFGFAGPLTEAVLLGNVANRFPGQRLDWDTEALVVTNFPDANRHIHPRYREGWAVAGL